MKINDLAPWIAIAITLVLSILVPLFTQIANNRFQLKMKRLELAEKEEERVMHAYEEYFQKVGGCVIYAQKNNISDAGASIQRLYAYIPENMWPTLDNLFTEISDYELSKAQNSMQDISKWLASDIERRKKK